LIVDRHTALRHWTTIGVLAAIAATVAAPFFFSRFTVLQISVFLIGALLAESLGLVWGIGGIMCFGQAAFFGLGGYTYAVAVENLGDSTLPIMLSILLPAAAATVLGCFLFFGRLGDIYIGVVTLCVSLILFDFGNSTQDTFYTIGHAALNGFNGMSGVPSINLPFDPDTTIDTTSMFYLCAGSLIVVYVLFRTLLASPFGRVAVAIRHNEIRAGLIGYNAAAIKLALFVIGAGVAGYAGCLFANWNAFISPNVFGLPMMAQTIIWVVVGGLRTLTGPILGAIALQYLATILGSNSGFNVNMTLGFILMAVVVLLPEGIVPTALRGARWLVRLRLAPSPVPAPNAAVRPSPAAE
jgi:ABC-type branched-subunit amino acid transport system permease subunit